MLAGTASFLYVRLDRTLSHAIDQGLQTRAADLVALVRQSDSGLREAGRPWQEGTVAQVLDARGRVVDSTGDAPTRPLLGPHDRTRAFAGPRFLDRPGERLFTVPANAQDKRLLIVVGASTENRAEALSTLRTELLLGGPATLLLVSLLAYALAHASLRPVETMRRRASAISGERPGERLPLPRARDEVALLGETLNEMLARLEQALERERRFVADASHELRTPLTLLKGEIELALEDEQGAAALRTALRLAGEETDRLVRLAEDLLLLARADRGSLPLRKERLEADELLDAIATRFELRAREDSRAIHVQTSNLVLEGDRLRLEQALSNLVDNALRYGAGAVTLGAEQRADAVALHVVDEGTGFPEEFLGRAFEPFARGGGTSSEGAGLGLAIVAAIARAHGGVARLSKHAGCGVCVTIPIACSSQEAAPDPRRAAAAGA